MASSRIKFKTSEDFKDKVVNEFLPTLQACLGSRVTYTFSHQDICELQVMTGFMPKTYSVYRNSLTGEAEYCEGKINKYASKNIN